MDTAIGFLFRFFTFAAQGILVEIIYTGIESRFWKKDKRWMGHCSAKMCVAYSLLSVIVYFLYYDWLVTYPWYVRAMAYGLIAHILEYFLGAFLYWRTGEYHWFYNGRGHVHHHTNLVSFPLFALCGMIFEWNLLYIKLLF